MYWAVSTPCEYFEPLNVSKYPPGTKILHIFCVPTIDINKHVYVNLWAHHSDGLCWRAMWGSIPQPPANILWYVFPITGESNPVIFPKRKLPAAAAAVAALAQCDATQHWVVLRCNAFLPRNFCTVSISRRLTYRNTLKIYVKRTGYVRNIFRYQDIWGQTETAVLSNVWKTLFFTCCKGLPFHV